MKDLEFLYNLLKKHFYSPFGLIIGYAFLILGIKFLNPEIKSIIQDKNIRVSLYLFSLIFWTFSWIISRNYFPKANRDKIGILVAINSENEKQKNRIKVDFTKRLKNDLERNNLLNLFHILIFNDYRSVAAKDILQKYVEKREEFDKNKIDFKSRSKVPKEFKKWEKFKNKVRVHFYIWGTIIERLEVENKYLLDISGLVVHRPLKKIQRDKIRKQFISVFPKEISFFEKFEISGFRFTADTVYIAARYITGLAALYSGDPRTALKLHKGLKGEINRYINPLPPNLSQINRNISNLILTENNLIARYEYAINKNIRATKSFLDKCLKQNPCHYDSLILKSYIAFKDEKNPVLSIKLLNKARRYCMGDYTWLYNKAFILMYLGKFEDSYKLYKKIKDLTFPNEPRIVEESIKFNEELLKIEPNKLQSFFVIGFLYFFKKNNLPMAFDSFEKFIKAANNKTEYDFLSNITIGFLSEIKEALKLK